jgi:hypothetical protein
VIKPIWKVLRKIFFKEKNVRALVKEWTDSTETKLDDYGAEIVLDYMYGDLSDIGEDLYKFIQEAKKTKLETKG